MVPRAAALLLSVEAIKSSYWIPVMAKLRIPPAAILVRCSQKTAPVNPLVPLPTEVINERRRNWACECLFL